MSAECVVPELGENIETATVVEILVSVGDEISAGQSVLSLETDKAEFEMPSNVAGRVAQLLVGAGDEVRVGQAVLRVEGAAEDDAASESEAPQAADGGGDEAEPDSPGGSDTPAGREREAEPESPGASGPDRAPEPPAAEPAGREDEEPAEPVSRVGRAQKPREDAPREKSPSAGGAPVAAAPSVRRLARELGVDLAGVSGSAAGGRVLAEDVTAYVRRTLAAAKQPDAAAASPTPSDFSKWGPVDVEPMSKVRRKTAEQMSAAWNRIPHVTHHDAADVTELDTLRKQYSARVERAGGKLTMTAILLNVFASALKKFPKFNASIDVDSASIVYKRYVHIGVAVDTDKGLLVPVIRDVDKKNIVEIARALAEVSEKARNRNIRPDELQGASCTITNLGGIGGRAFSPLINPPEVAILGVSRTRDEVVPVSGGFEARRVLPLSVSYDHRVIDGADAARFLRWICEALEEPFLVELEGV